MPSGGEPAVACAEAVVEGLDCRAHATELVRVAETVLEHRLMDRGHALSLGQSSHQRGLPVRGETRVGSGLGEAW